VPDFSRCVVTWSEHGLGRAYRRGVSTDDAEAIVHGSAEQEPARHGRWLVWGCVTGRRTKIVVRSMKGDVCLIISVIRTAMPCR